jgi:hypothetical protein
VKREPDTQSSVTRVGGRHAAGNSLRNPIDLSDDSEDYDDLIGGGGHRPTPIVAASSSSVNVAVAMPVPTAAVANVEVRMKGNKRLCAVWLPNKGKKVIFAATR